MVLIESAILYVTHAGLFAYLQISSCEFLDRLRPWTTFMHNLPYVFHSGLLGYLAASLREFFDPLNTWKPFLHKMWSILSCGPSPKA